MTTALKEEAWQSGLVLLDETAEWNYQDWPSLMGGARGDHATVVLDHPDTDKDNNNKEHTVVVMGGYRTGQGELDSVLTLNLSHPSKQWREGPPMNRGRSGHAAVVCNGGVYVMGGYSRGLLDCIERIDANDVLQSSSTSCSTHESHWTTLNCRLPRGKSGCCVVAVHNRYIVVMGGYSNRYWSSVDIVDTSNHTLIEGPSMTVPRSYFVSAVVGHRIFVVGGRNDDNVLDSVEYLDFAEERKDDSLTTVISFSSAWTTHSELVLSNPRAFCAMVAVGSCLVVAGGRSNLSVEVLDTLRNRVWNLRRLQEQRWCCSMVTVANQVAVIGGLDNRTCATFPLMDKNTWCFRRLYEQPQNEWYQFREGMGIRDADISRFSTSTSARKRARSNAHRGDEGKDET